MRKKKEILNWFCKLNPIFSRNEIYKENPQFNQEIRENIQQKLKNAPDTFIPIYTPFYDEGFKYLFELSHETNCFFLKDFLNGLKIFGNISDVSPLFQDSSIVKNGKLYARRQDIAILCKKYMGSKEHKLALGIEMQFQARDNYFCSIRDYITAMKEKYDDISILLIAKNSTQFLAQLQLFSSKKVMDRQKLSELKDINYPKEGRVQFVEETNMIKRHRSYYWTYMEQGCPIHCILLDELQKKCKDGDHTRISFPVNGKSQQAKYFTKIILKVLSIDKQYIKKARNGQSIIAFPMAVYNLLTTREKIYIDCIQFNKPQQCRADLQREIHNECLAYNTQKQTLDNAWTQKIQQLYYHYQYIITQDNQIQNQQDAQNMKLQEASQIIQPVNITDKKIANAVLHKINMQFQNQQTDEVKLQLKLLWNRIKERLQKIQPNNQ